MISDEIINVLQRLVKQVGRARLEVANQNVEGAFSKQERIAKNSLYMDKGIFDALSKLSTPLANTYLQIIAEFEDESRLSWIGTAHAIRELLRNLLELLAPDSRVVAQIGYKPEKDTSGPTQRQKVSFILMSKGADASIGKVTKNIEIISELVRDTYGRASDAAHRIKEKGEVFQLLRYFTAFAHDLLD